MRRVGFAVLLGLVFGCSSGNPTAPTSSATEPDAVAVVVPSEADHGGKALVANLFPPLGGAQAGTLMFSANGGQGEACYLMRLDAGVPTPTSVDLYRVPTGTYGVQTLVFAEHTHGCDSTTFTVAFLRDIARSPNEYGVDVYAGTVLVLRGRFEHMKQPYK